VQRETLLRRAGTQQRGPRISSAPRRKRHSASKTRVNALVALRSIRGTQAKLRAIRRNQRPIQMPEAPLTFLKDVV